MAGDLTIAWRVNEPASILESIAKRGVTANHVGPAAPTSSFLLGKLVLQQLEHDIANGPARGVQGNPAQGLTLAFRGSDPRLVSLSHRFDNVADDVAKNFLANLAPWQNDPLLEPANLQTERI